MSDIRKHIDLIAERSYDGNKLIPGTETDAVVPNYHDGAPEIGTKFTFKDKVYACVGWMVEQRIPGQFGKRGANLIACRHDQATWVIGMGGGGPGTIAPMSQIRVVGQMKWSEEQRSKVVDSAMLAISKKLTLVKPNTP
jgi:hypothetical protein